MAAFKVSVAFLEGPVDIIITKGEHIAKCMEGNENFPSPPITADGVKTAVDHLKKMEKKTRAGHQKDVQNRDIALADVDDFIRQNAKYVNHVASYDKDKLLSSGYDFNTLGEVKAVEAADKWMIF